MDIIYTVEFPPNSLSWDKVAGLERTKNRGAYKYKSVYQINYNSHNR